jgi:Ca2+/Na+ antiporter
MVSTTATKVLASILLVVWLLFLLHIVETTTNEYFCTSLQLAVAILKLSPNVAGVTFLAVGNAACDVIASIAAFATGVPKVGVGTTIGAGIFVTTAVIAAVSFVADVRLARRSFVRDVLFFIGTILYLLYTTLDGIITLPEAIGYMAIYALFVIIVAGGRFVRSMRKEEEEDDSSIAGSGAEDAEAKAEAVAEGGGSYQQPGTSAAKDDGSNGMSHEMLEAKRVMLLGELDAARRELMAGQYAKELEELKRNKMFRGVSTVGIGLGRESSFAIRTATRRNSRADSSASLYDAESGDGPPYAGSGGGSPGGRVPPRLSRAGSIMGMTLDDLPTKPSAWTAAFDSTQESGKSGSKYSAYALPTYHRRKLAKELAARLAARGIHHMVTTEEGRVVDIAELSVTDPDAAANILSRAAAAITATAIKSGGGLSYDDAAAAGETSGLVGASGDGGSTADLLAVLPKETVKPVADMYLRARYFMGLIGPYYHGFMHTCERPVIVARHLTIPLLHPGAYRRRLVALTMPFSAGLFTFVTTTHVIKTVTDYKGVPLFVIAGCAGVFLSVLLLLLLPTKEGQRRGRADSSSSLLKNRATPVKVGAPPPAPAPANDHDEHDAPRWWTPAVNYVCGRFDDPLPTGYSFSLFLLWSFVMSLYWLLLIANELVGTALAFGKILNIPDTVMGLVVLAVGNSINDLAASVTIAREGFPSMAVAGAYAGPMFNVLAGIGLPMCIYTSNGVPYAIGSDTPLIQVRAGPLPSASPLLVAATTRDSPLTLSSPSVASPRPSADGLRDAPWLARYHPHLGAPRGLPHHAPHRPLPYGLVRRVYPSRHHHRLHSLSSVGGRPGHCGVGRGL